MKIILFFPALLSFICVVLFMYTASIIAFPVLGVMLLTCPHAPFVFGYKAFKNILNGDFKTAFE